MTGRPNFPCHLGAQAGDPTIAPGSRAETPFPRANPSLSPPPPSISLSLCSHHSGAAGQNKQHSITKNTAKLDRETEELHHDRVTLEVGKVIQQGRQSKGLTQKDLATVSVAAPPPGCGRAGDLGGCGWA